MAAGLAPETYKEAILFLATAGVVVPLFHRLRVSPVLGFLGAGALLGPHGLGRLAGEAPALAWFTIADGDEIAHLAELGVVFLMFTIGLELSWQRLRLLRRLVFGLGSLQVLASALALGLLAGALGNPMTASALIGLSLALSSTAIIVPVLAEQKRLNSPAGRASFSVLLFQDLAVAPVLFAITMLATGESGNMGLVFVTALLKAGLALALLVGLGRLVMRRLFQLVAATRSPELFMATCLLVVVSTGFIAAKSGLSMALGAFVAGLLLAETEYRRAVEAMIDPFKGLLLGVFFVSVGMHLDFRELIDSPGAILAVALGLMAVKGVVVALLCGLFRLGRVVALETALLLGPGGEFAFVILGSAMAANLVPAAVGQALLIVTTVTMIAIPLVARLGLGFGDRLERSDLVKLMPEIPPSAEARVIVAGFGRVGQLVGEMLARHGVPYIAVDMNPALVAAQSRGGQPVYYGDASNPEFLRHCGIAAARGIVVTLDTPSLIEAVVTAARSERRDLTIVARARDARHATALYELGVDDAVPETIEASLQLSEAVLVDVGVPMGLVIASIHERREEFRKVLKRDDGSGQAPTAEFRGRRRSSRAAVRGR